MRILLITEFFPTGKDLRFSGGVEARTFFVAKHLCKRHKITVLASRTIGTTAKERISGFDVYRVGPPRDYTASVGHLISRLIFVKNAIKFAKDLDLDIVDGGNYIAHFIAKKIAKTKKIPAVAWYPDVWLGEWFRNAGIYGVFGEILERYNLRSNFDSYIAISRQTAKKLNRFSKKRAKIIYCGVDKNEFVGNLKKFKDPTIICVSRLTKYKNIKTLILAFAHLQLTVKNANLIIVGTGPEENNLKDLAKSLKISKSVKFLSNLPRKELVNLYKSSHIFSLPSIVEGFGIATIEAAAASLPYVNSNIPIQREITKNGQGGFLVESSSALSYSQKLHLLIKNQSLCIQKSKQAQKLASLYSWQKIAEETESVYKYLYSKNPQ